MYRTKNSIKFAFSNALYSLIKPLLFNIFEVVWFQFITITIKHWKTALTGCLKISQAALYFFICQALMTFFVVFLYLVHMHALLYSLSLSFALAYSPVK